MHTYFTMSFISLAEYPYNFCEIFFISFLLRLYAIYFKLCNTKLYLVYKLGRPTYTNLLNLLSAAKSISLGKLVAPMTIT